MKNAFWVVFLSILLLASPVAMAHGGRQGMGMDHRWGMGYGPWGSKLNLSSEQIQKLQALQDNFSKEIIPLRNDLRARQLELKALWLQVNPDEEKVLAKQKEISALRDQIQEKGIKYRLEARKVLTPEQQAKLGQYLESFGKFMPGFHNRDGSRMGMRGHWQRW